MTDEASETNATQQPDDKAPAPYHPRPDFVLQMLVDSANSGDRLQIILTVGGMTISGLLVGAKEYYREVGEQQNVGFMKAIFETWKPNEGYVPPEYIHIKQPKIRLGAFALNTAEPLWWRGRISEVSGFIYGGSDEPIVEK